MDWKEESLRADLNQGIYDYSTDTDNNKFRAYILRKIREMKKGGYKDFLDTEQKEFLKSQGIKF